MIGIRKIFRLTANVAVAASTALVDLTDLNVPIAASQRVKVRFWLPFSVGATGGFKFNLAVPAGGTAYLATLQVVDGTAAAPGNEVATVQTAAADFANAWANTGNHYLLVEAMVTNGATAGNITLKMACNSAANAITALAGGTSEAVVL